MKRLPMKWIREGDDVWIRAKVIGQNVGGQLHIETLEAYYQTKVQAWVNRSDAKPVEPLSVRLKRSVSKWLWSKAFALNPDKKD